MRNLSSEYWSIAKCKNVVSICLKKAKKLFPDQELSYCGWEESWDDCLSGYRDEDTGQLIFLLYFNIGKATRAVDFRL